MSSEPNIVFGLDLGTTKVSCVVAEFEGRDINILGVGTHPSHGLEMGILVDMDATANSIVSAVEQAEEMSGEEVREAYVGIAGGHIKSQNARGIVTIADGVVTERDINRLIDSAKARFLTADRELIQATPGTYSLDGQDAVENPLGMHGRRMEADVHIVTGQVADTNNLVGCVRSAGIAVNGIVLEQVASGAAVLSESEKQFGAILIDCGGGTTDIAVFQDRCIKYTQNLTIGGDNVDKDIAHWLSLPLDEARRVKEEHGVALVEMALEEKNIDVKGLGGISHISHYELSRAIDARMGEIFELARDEIPLYKELSNSPARVVLTGGSLIMEGAVRSAEEIFEMPVRLGSPFGIGGYSDMVSTPAYSTVVGLIHYGIKYFGNSDKVRGRGGSSTFKKIRNWMENWFNEINYF